jgi:hypothetical protein
LETKLREETRFLDGLSPEIGLGVIWPKLVEEMEDKGQLVQLLCNLQGVCRAWQEWVEGQVEWDHVRSFGEYLFDEIDEGICDCDSNGLPYDMYPEGYWDEY